MSLASWLPWLSESAVSDTKGARQRDQPCLAAIAEAFASGEDEAHLQRGCEPGVEMVELTSEPDAEAEWPQWRDPWQARQVLNA